jgi:hypothetical protein
MKQVFVFERVAVIVMPWHEPMDPPERGARVEIRLLGNEPPRGSRYAAERVVLDEPLFRADLFDQTTAPPGNLNSAHFHATFYGIEPCDRMWSTDLKQDAAAWLAHQLSDLRALLVRSKRTDISGDTWVDSDTAALEDAAPAIVAAVEATWATVRAEP